MIEFFTNRIVDIWNSLPAAVVLSPSVAVFKRNLAKFTFNSFLTLLIIICVNVCLHILCRVFYTVM